MAQAEDESKATLMVEVMALLEQAGEKFEPDAGEMQRWMAANIANPAVIALLQNTTLLMMRVLDAIGRDEPVNGITIARQYRIPKGSVSKGTRRLLAQKLISKEALPNNKKEVLFRLTPLGRELFVAHRAFDQQMEQGFYRFLGRYDSAELGFIIRVIRDLISTSFLDEEENKES